MSKFIGQPCTSCRSILTERDDIVVCPECGSPYHKECYKNEGKCINTALHESGKSWQPEVVLSDGTGENPDISVDTTVEHKTVACKNCGAENDSESAFCKQCGAPVNMEKAAGTIYQRIKQDDEADSRGFGGYGGMPFIDIRPINKETDVDGNTVGEYTKYVGKSFYYYIPKFLRFSKNSNVSMNFSAMLFPEFYFFYRKMIPEGLVALVLKILLSIPYAIYLVYTYSGNAAPSILEQQWFLSLYNVTYFLSYGISLACGLFANRLYYRKAKKDLGRIKTTVLEEGSRNSAIASAGGTSWINVIAAFMVQLIADAAILCAIAYFAFGAK